MRTLILAAALAIGVGPALADETVIHRDGPGPGPVVHDRTVVKERSSDCASKTVHKENGAGDSKTVTQTDC